MFLINVHKSQLRKRKRSRQRKRRGTSFLIAQLDDLCFSIFRFFVLMPIAYRWFPPMIYFKTEICEKYRTTMC